MSMNTVPERLAALRAAMAANGVAVYLIPVGDPHASEYLPAHYTSLTWFSGFHGENSNLVVTRTGSALWADGRYFVQAEKELAVHDFILENVRYDKLKKPYSHEILGPMTQGVGVCEGIAKTVKALCDQLGLWCIVALSEADPARGIKYRHTWNVVRVGGQYYHLDATFDNSLQRGGKRYDYYNLDDGRLFRDHTPLVLPVPACTDGKGFYYRSVSFTKPEELEKRLAQALRKKQPLFVFHWRGGYLTREVLAELCLQIDAAAQARGRAAAISVNWPQAVLQVHFVDAAQPVETESLEDI